MVPVQAKYKIWCISINNDSLYIISIPMSNDTITMKRQFYGFSWMKMYEFRLKFHWSLFLGNLMNNIPALTQIMAWRRPGDKPLSEPMMLRILTHICVTRPHWVKKGVYHKTLDGISSYTSKFNFLVSSFCRYCLDFFKRSFGLNFYSINIRIRSK